MLEPDVDMSASHWPPRCPEAGTGRIPRGRRVGCRPIRHRTMTPIPTHDLSAHRRAEGQTPQRTRPPPPDPPHPWHIGLPVSGSRCGHRQSPGAGGSRRTLPCPGCSAVGRRADVNAEQDRAEMVNRIRPCLDRTDICTATLGVVSRQTGVRRGRHQAAAGGLRGHLQELRRRVRAALPATRIRPLGTCPASSKAHAQGEADDAGCVTTHLRRWALPGPLWCGSAEARRSGQSARCHPPGGTADITRNRHRYTCLEGARHYFSVHPACQGPSASRRG